MSGRGKWEDMTAKYRGTHGKDTTKYVSSEDQKTVYAGPGSVIDVIREKKRKDLEASYQE
jgi:hypothetical protein